jgi:predicted Zn-dependent peptidase
VPQFKKVTLKNGLRVVLVPHADTAAAAILVLHEVGSRYESDALAGTAHYLEHLMFKGTTRRPSTLDISRALDAVGADYNAFTWRDCTGYYIKLVADKLPLAADMLGDMLRDSLFRQEDIDQERNVILEEIRMYEDNPMMQVDAIMEEELYAGSSLGRQVAGSIKTVSELTRADIVGFHQKHYLPRRTVVAVAGKFDEAEALALVEKHFSWQPKAGHGPGYRRYDIAKGGPRRARTRLIAKDTEQYQVALGFPGYGLGQDRLAAQSILNIILGGTMSSRLFVEVREKRGLAYFVRSSSNVYQDVGNVAIQAGVAKDRLPDALKVIMTEIRKTKDKLVSAAELAMAKDYVKGKMMLHLEESSELAEWFARQELLEHRMVPPEEKLQRLYAVTAADVQRVAREVFRPNRLALAIIGPAKDEKEIATAIKTLL